MLSLKCIKKFKIYKNVVNVIFFGLQTQMIKLKKLITVKIVSLHITEFLLYIYNLKNKIYIFYGLY